METGFRKLFSRSKTSRSRSSSLRLEAQAYDSAVAGKAPVRGSYPVVGNGPAPIIRLRGKQNSLRPSIELVAALPVVPQRRYSEVRRPQTAPQRVFEWPRSRFPMDAPPTLLRKSRRERSASDAHTANRFQHIPAFASDARQYDERAPSIDLLDAVWHINPSRETYIQRTKAS